VRLGCSSPCGFGLACHQRFNEAEARAPRMRARPTPGYPLRQRFNEAEARAPRMRGSLAYHDETVPASMRPRRVRLGCLRIAWPCWSQQRSFNEAEARAPRMPLVEADTFTCGHWLQ